MDLENEIQSAKYKLLTWDGIQYDTLVTNNWGDFIVCVTQYNSEIYVGGNFDTLNGTACKYIAKYDGNNIISLPVSFTGVINTFFVINNELYAGGHFDSVNTYHSPGIAKYDGTNWTSVGGGIDDTYYATNVYNIAEYNGRLYACGRFTTDNVNPNNGINDLSVFNGTSWEKVPGYTQPINGSNYIMCVYKNKLYIGGEFTKADGALGNYIISWNDTVWSDVGGGVNGVIADLLVYYNELYAVRSFNMAGGVPAERIAKWDGEKWCNVGDSHFNNIITDLAVYNNELYISGGFTTIDGDSIPSFAKWVSGIYTDTCGAINHVIKKQNEREDIYIYLNPVNNEINILLPDLEYKTIHVSLITINGSKIFEKEFNGNNNYIIINDLKAEKGIYFLKISTDEIVEVKKLIIN
jgi:hypothetical protein